MTILLFILLLFVTFGVLIYFLRPTTTETAVQQHLEHIEENRSDTRHDDADAVAYVARAY